MIFLNLNNEMVEIQFEDMDIGKFTEVYYSVGDAEKIKIGDFYSNNIVFKKPESEQRLFYTLYTNGKEYIVSNRKINLEGTFNTRDFGGYTGYQGRTIKWGIFYRSDSLHKITENDKKILKELNIKTVVDLRGADEIAKEPDNLFEEVKYINLPPHAEVAQLASGNITNDKTKVEELVRLASTEQGRKKLIDRQNDMEIQMRDLVRQEIANEQYHKYLSLLFESSNVPILHHCKGGKDRAGFATVLVLIILGVDKNTIMYDYMLTKDFMDERNIKRMNEYKQYTDNKFVLDYLYSLMQTKESYLEAAFDEIIKMSGDFDSYINNVLEISSESVARLREIYLER